MKWSKYNYLFHSSKYGWLLYNSISNTFLKIEDDMLNTISKMKEQGDIEKLSLDSDTYLLLRFYNFIVSDEEEKAFLNMTKLLRYQNNFNSLRMSLTIAPTRDCNFNCIYCYEKSRPPIYMDKDVEDNIIKFVKNSGVRYLFVTWYGGEPLLAFDTIKSLTQKILNLNIGFEALLVTNGYLLTEDKIKLLSSLKIKKMQITLDGLKNIHDKRRPLKGGKGTFDKIVKNIDNLLPNWNGRLSIRVNVDRSNKKDFIEIYNWLTNRYEKYLDNIHIYPGIVHDNNQINPTLSCFKNRDEEAEFLIEVYKTGKVNRLSFYPQKFIGTCIALNRNGFLIDPEGKVYKCWEDIGMEEYVVGNVDLKQPWNNQLIAKYMIEGSYLEDKECDECFFFPICDGGCPRIRIMLGRERKERLCSRFRNYLDKFLEIHYEKKLEKN